MREIDVGKITEAVRRMCISSNYHLPGDIRQAIGTALEREDGAIARGILGQLIENEKMASEREVPICQDTGMACVFLEVGQDVHLTGGDLYDAVHEGVRLGYTEGYLRKSVERDPVRRGNTGDNTPAMITTDIVPGDRIQITVAPKGFGSENMGALKMLKPSAGLEGIKDFILETVEQAGPNPCPPIVVVSGSAETLTMSRFLQRKRCSGRLQSAIRIRSMPHWRKSFWTESMHWESVRRALAAGRQRLV